VTVAELRGLLPQEVLGLLQLHAYYSGLAGTLNALRVQIERA
jgi:hypothetical protein